MRATGFLLAALLGLSGPVALADDAKSLETERLEMQRLASSGPTRAEKNVASDFSGLAGSDDNAEKLVSALRTGSNADLVWKDADGKTVTTTIDPATGKMGLGNVFISLALARESLKQAGISNPTPVQLDAALNGGSVTVDGKAITLSGVLAQRAAGAGWGRIAQSLGVKLGRVVSAIRSENGRLRAAVDRPKSEAKRDAAARGGRDVTGAKQDRAGGAGRPERPERPGQGNRPERPERAR